MITLSVTTFLVILEVVLVLLFLLGFVIWRQRRQHARDRIQFIDGADDHPTPALYLEAEAAKTRTHLEALGGAPGAGDEADLEQEPGPVSPALALRVALLELEAELSKAPSEERAPEFWQSLSDRLGELISTQGFATAVISEPAAEPAPNASPAPDPSPPPAPVMEDEDASVAGLVEQQAKTIDFLRNYIQELLDNHGHQPSPEPQLTEQFDNLERANKELSQCVSVLEDENGFLRDQIAALLQMEK